MKPPKARLSTRHDPYYIEHIVETHGPFEGPVKAGDLLEVLATLPPDAKVALNCYQDVGTLIPNNDVTHWVLTAEWCGCCNLSKETLHA